MQPTTHKALTYWRSAAFAMWLLVGIGCILLDGGIEPELNRLGHVSSVRSAAQLWEQLGTTPGIVLFNLSGAILFRQDKGRTLLHFVVSGSLAGATVQNSKYLIGRVRPMATGDSTVFAGPFGLFNSGTLRRIDSMPSGHTTAAFAMAVALAYRWPKLALLWIALAAGVGLSRTLVDAHFPSDVILGALLGTVIGLLSNRWARRCTYISAATTDQLNQQPTASNKWQSQ
jgi:membrane-associated phospholipid phosphatase